MSFNQFLIDHSWSAGSLEEIHPDLLTQRQIKGLVLDFDGVLAAADRMSISSLMSEWIDRMVTAGFFIAIHSNNNTFREEQRKYYMALKHPAVRWMPAVPKKPNPLTILTLSQQWCIAPHCIVMIDDRLWTGGKAAYEARAKFLYIDRPEADYQKGFWTEMGCHGIRYVERMVHGVPAQRWCAREDSNL